MNLIRLRCDSKLKKIRPFKFLTWHHGFMYFKAQSRDGENVFIKVDTQIFCIENEAHICSLLNSKSFISAPNVKFFKKYNGMSVVIFDYIDGEALKSKSLREKPELVIDAFKILKEFTRLGLCHRDIKFDNFILTDKLILIDFTYVEKLPLYNNDLILAKAPDRIEKDLGFHLSVSPRAWNDYYSFNRMIDEAFGNSNVDCQYYHDIYQIKKECNDRANNQQYTFCSKGNVIN
jgi:serine/threonine protein kinase